MEEIGLTKKKKKFLRKYCTLQNAGLGQESFKCESCVSPTGPDHSKNRETVFSDHCHQTGPVSGGRRDRNVCQTSQMS